jgi:hypothetical protein
MMILICEEDENEIIAADADPSSWNFVSEDDEYDYMQYLKAVMKTLLLFSLLQRNLNLRREGFVMDDDTQNEKKSSFSRVQK